MNLPLMQIYRLAPRGGGGLACDKAGVALGPTELVRVGVDATGRRRYEVRPRRALERILGAAYGPQSEDVVLRLDRRLRRAASAIQAGDLCLAGIETVLLGLSDLTHSALAKLAEIDELEKDGAAWETEPRVPAGRPDGGQWTTAEGAGGAPSARAVASPAPHPFVSNDKPVLPLDDGVYRPGGDAPHVILTGGAEEEEPPSRRSNDPDELRTLEDVFPGLGHLVHIVLAPIDGFLGASAVVEEADLAVTMGRYWRLIREIKQVDPSFVDNELLPPDGIAGLSSQERTNLLDNLRMVRAAAYYRMRGDVGPLQVETLRFLQHTVDALYDEAVSAADAGRLQPRLSREEAIGNYMDVKIRAQIRQLFDDYNIPYGPGMDVTVNNRDYDRSESRKDYRVPDARLRDVSFDWTLTPKSMSTPQVRGFFRTDSRVRAVIIIRPSRLGRESTYLIPRLPDDFL